MQITHKNLDKLVELMQDLRDEWEQIESTIDDVEMAADQWRDNDPKQATTTDDREDAAAERESARDQLADLFGDLSEQLDRFRMAAQDLARHADFELEA